jgi:hypothetical protein
LTAVPTSLREPSAQESLWKNPRNKHPRILIGRRGKKSAFDWFSETERIFTASYLYVLNSILIYPPALGFQFDRGISDQMTKKVIKSDVWKSRGEI